MTMEILNQIINGAMNFTFGAIVLVLSVFTLAAIWKWLIGICIRFMHWLFPGLMSKKKDNQNTKF